MKGLFFTEEQLVELARRLDQLREDAYGYRRYTDEELANKIFEAMHSEPFEINDISISEVNVPCKYYVRSNIVGFVQKDGILRGVFIKE